MTTTTSPRAARLPPSVVELLADPVVKPPPYMYTMTGFKGDLAELGRDVVQMFRKRQSVLPEAVLPFGCRHSGALDRA